MKVNAQWKENMTFIGMPDSGFPVQMDADSYFGGTNQGVRPMEMVALGLAAEIQAKLGYGVDVPHYQQAVELA